MNGAAGKNILPAGSVNTAAAGNADVSRAHGSENAGQASTRGADPEALECSHASECVIALDIGGTFIKSGLYADGQLCRTVKTPTGSDSLESLLRSVSAAVETQLDKSESCCGIAVSSAGDIDPYTGRCLYATDNLKGYSGFAIREWLEEKYEMRASAINDGHAALLGEASYRGLTCPTVMLTLVTGVGGAYYDGKKIVFGPDFRYGRFGHLCLRKNGRRCNCGQQGCIEQYVSATALAAECALAGTAPERVFTETLPRSRRIVEEWLDLLAEAMETVYRAQPYELMIFGGGVCGSAELWLPLLRQKTRFRAEVSSLGNSAGLEGAYRWWCEHE